MPRRRAASVWLFFASAIASRTACFSTCRIYCSSGRFRAGSVSSIKGSTCRGGACSWVDARVHARIASARRTSTCCSARRRSSGSEAKGLRPDAKSVAIRRESLSSRSCRNIGTFRLCPSEETMGNAVAAVSSAARVSSSSRASSANLRANLIASSGKVGIIRPNFVVGNPVIRLNFKQ